MIIIAWTGGTIPSGWVLCNGSNSTPDLRNRFIYGASIDSDVGNTGGADTHTHTNPDTGSDGAHNHGTKSATTGGPSTTVSGSAGLYECSSNAHTHSVSISTGNCASHTHDVGDTNSASTLPPYIKRVFIMKL